MMVSIPQKNIATKYIYKTLSENDTTLSSGVLVNDLHFASEKTVDNKNYLTLSSASKNPLGLTQGSHIGYTEVTVLYGENGEYGKSTHRFRSSLQAPDLMPEGPPGTTFFENGGVTSRDWKRGQLISTEDFDNSGNLNRKLQNNYTFHRDSIPDATHRYRAMAVKWTGQTIPGQTPPNDKVFSSNSYEIVAGWVYKDTEMVTIYGSTVNDSIEINTSFFYDNPNHIQLTKTIETNTDGTQRITEFKYAEDYSNTSGSSDPYVQAIDSMKAKNMHSLVIEKVIYEKKPGQSQQVMSAELNLYKEFAPGQILPYQRLILSSSTPVTNFAPSSVVSGNFNYDSRYLVQETMEQYDTYGNLLLRKDANNVPTASKWGYNTSLLVGRIGKALPGQSAISVFDDGDESDWSGSAGTWVIQNGVYKQTDGTTTAPWTNPRYNNTAGVDDGVFEADIRFDNAGTYRYAGIAKYINSINLIRFELRKTDSRVRISATINGATISAENNQTFNENQWYHLRGEIQGTVAKLYLDGILLVTLNNGNVDLGSGQIGLCTYGTRASFDNVRMYPTEALAFSSSYDLLFLTINAQTDESGNSTLFFYDSFGRLVAVKDLQGNVFQKIAYFIHAALLPMKPLIPQIPTTFRKHGSAVPPIPQSPPPILMGWEERFRFRCARALTILFSISPMTVAEERIRCIKLLSKTPPINT